MAEKVLVLTCASITVIEKVMNKINSSAEITCLVQETSIQKISNQFKNVKVISLGETYFSYEAFCKNVKFTDKFLIDNDNYEFTLKYEDLKINGIYIDNEYQVFVVENGEPITNKKIGKEFALLMPLTNERYYTYIAPDDEDDEMIEEEFNLNVFDAQGLPPKSIFLSDIGLIWQIIENKKGSTDVKLIGSIYFDINDYPEARQNWFNYDPLLQRYKVLFLGDR